MERADTALLCIWHKNLVYLTEQGRLEVAAAANTLMATRIDAIFVSPFARTIETAEIFCSCTKSKFMVLNGLEERHFYSLSNWEYEKIASIYSEDIKQTLVRNSDLVCFDGEETLENSQIRVTEAINYILSKEFENSLVISHGRPHSWLCCSFLKLPLSNSRIFNLNPANLSMFKFSDKKFMQIYSLNTRNF